jgi:hypothetical protein
MKSGGRQRQGKEATLTRILGLLQDCVASYVLYKSTFYSFERQGLATLISRCGMEFLVLRNFAAPHHSSISRCETHFTRREMPGA